MSLRHEFIASVEQHRAVLVGLGVRRLGLFGSVKRGEESATSDFDVIVEFAPGQKSFRRLVDVGDLLEQALGRSVDLVTPEGLSPHLGPKILGEAEYVALAS